MSGVDPRPDYQKYRLRQSRFFGRVRGRPDRYEGPFGPGFVGSRDSDEYTSVWGPDLPTAKVAATIDKVGLLDGSWEFEATIGADRFSISRDEPGLASASYAVRVAGPLGTYTLAKRHIEGVGWNRPDGSVLERRHRWFTGDVTAVEVAMVLLVYGSGLGAQVDLHMI